MISKPTLLVLASTYPRWLDDSEPGFVHELCRRLTKHFHVVALVPDAPGACQTEQMDGVHVVRYRYAFRRWQILVNDGGIVANLRRDPWKYLLVPGFILGQLWTARRILCSYQVDVIHAHWLIPQGIVARLLGRRFHIPYLVTSHGGDLYGLKGKALTAVKRWVTKSACALTVVSRAMKAEAARMAIVSSSVSVVPMGVDLFGRFVPDEMTRREADHLLFVGRLVAKKGLNHLIDAMPTIIKMRPNAQLSIVGFGPEEQVLRKQAQRLSVEDRVHFIGACLQHNLPEWYRRASVFVAPFVRDASGDQEGLPVAAMEAVACGCPVILGDVAGIDDLLGFDVNDIRVNPTDKAALACLITSVLENPIEAEQRAARLRVRISGILDWSVIADSYAKILMGCIQQ
jgi:glycosyltransferase involved in cell wall biosynthesis